MSMYKENLKHKPPNSYIQTTKLEKAFLEKSTDSNVNPYQQPQVTELVEGKSRSSSTCFLLFVLIPSSFSKNLLPFVWWCEC